jgi:hypothetical protein
MRWGARCVVQFAESGAHPYLVSTRYRCVIGKETRMCEACPQCTCTASHLTSKPPPLHAHPAGMR